MNIATILFTYNRSCHTKAVLDALEKNMVHPQKLYIFQDGMKETTNRHEWNKVRKIITTVLWCDAEVIISDENKGLAQSVKAGVRYVFEKFDAVIVLEDDCVPHPQFMEYMVKALNKYADCKNVYHIGASSEPVDVIANGTDAYFLGRINSCGWGTWKDRWEQFCDDYTLIGKIKKDVEINEWFKLWGEDVESHILGNIYGRTDSWAAFWALTVIMKKGYCMSPYESLVNNIGFDGTGVHCGIMKNTLKLRAAENLAEIILPDKIELVEGYRKSFACYYPWIDPSVKNEYYKKVALRLLELQRRKRSIADWLIERKYDCVTIWGKNELCDYLIDEIKNKVSVDAIVETQLKDREYNGIPVIDWKHISDNSSLIIIVPGYDVERIRNMVGDTNLINRMIPIDELAEKIYS